ncbi:MAG TPA: hypothetical protein VGR81_03405 [Candidatus Acidoferrales bacterium]|nr:hypothetical protein [Candidatus Acidoferrales bacterium]
MKRKRIAVLVSLLCSVAAGKIYAQNPANTPSASTQRISLANGVSIELPYDWAPRTDSHLATSGQMAASAPPLVFSELHFWDDSADSSVLAFGLSNNPFLGGDKNSLIAQILGGANAKPALLDYLFYFFFPPPPSCLDGAAAAFQAKARESAAGKSASSDAATPSDFTLLYDCTYSPSLADFYSYELSPRLQIRRASGAERWQPQTTNFYFPAMEEVQSNRLTFFVFEAQGEGAVTRETVEDFNVPEKLNATMTDYFWAVGAPTPFPFARVSLEKSEPLIQVAFASAGYGPNKRPDFLQILRRISSTWATPY